MSIGAWLRRQLFGCDRPCCMGVEEIQSAIAERRIADQRVDHALERLTLAAVGKRLPHKFDAAVEALSARKEGRDAVGG